MMQIVNIKIQKMQRCQSLGHFLISGHFSQMLLYKSSKCTSIVSNKIQGKWNFRKWLSDMTSFLTSCLYNGRYFITYFEVSGQSNNPCIWFDIFQLAFHHKYGSPTWFSEDGFHGRSRCLVLSAVYLRLPGKFEDFSWCQNMILFLIL